MLRGCLLTFGLLFVAALSGAMLFLSDPLKAIWQIADLNGGLSKWEQRVVRVVRIERRCSMTEGRNTLLRDTPETCPLPSALKSKFIEYNKYLATLPPCYSDSYPGEKCNSKSPFGFSGIATVTVEGVRARDEAFTAQLDVPSTKPQFYLLETGDLIEVGVCQKNPHIARIEARLVKVKGC